MHFFWCSSSVGGLVTDSSLAMDRDIQRTAIIASGRALASRVLCTIQTERCCRGRLGRFRVVRHKPLIRKLSARVALVSLGIQGKVVL